MENNFKKNRKQEIENKAKQILSGLTENEVEAKAKNYKKKQIILNSILGGVNTILFISYLIICFAYPDESFGFGGLIFYAILILSASIIPFVLIYITCKKSTEELAILQIKYEINTLNQIGGYYASVDLGEDFTVSQSLKISASGWTTKRLLVDNNNKRFAIQKGNKYTKIYKFSELINYEVYENGTSKVKGTAGKALIGGAFFGLGGLIVGSSMGRDIAERCNQLKLIIRVNDITCPQIVITYVDNVDWDKKGYTYRAMKENLQSICSTLEFILNAKSIEDNVVKTETDNDIKSNKEQLQELKEMLEEGLITQEEYEQKKKQILGL